MKDIFDLADKAISDAYPDCDNRGKGWWGAQRIPNYGILRGAIEKIIRNAIEAALKEKDDLLNVYQNTPFAHWHERALRAEEQIAALKAEIEQWKRVVVTHVEEIERLKEARTS